MITMWCISSGPDRSHLINCRWEHTLKSAKAQAEELSPTPSGAHPPYKIERFQWAKAADHYPSDVSTVIERL